MVCRRSTSFPQLLIVLSLILLSFGKSVSHARRAVLEVSTVDGTNKELALHGDSSFSSQKESNVGGDVPSAAAEVIKAYKIGGRRMNEKGQINTEASSSAGELEKEEHWKQVLMAFAVDYSSPKAHPPTHN
ncbi:hypothetical protein F511_14367 [Dorcoceras hygrometricum]|uniref:Uncharacterized protein n=1 Tax=Dorcoceras hygrometricum TaxID=472368 RepID=A0A2Z7A402_9LAMI|nr:hypothetical protein F511_14367 [Dorcoceras hygrometricum]